MSRLSALYALRNQVVDAIEEEHRRRSRIQALSDELVLPYEDPEPLSPCGTEAAHQRHRDHGERPCSDCRRAHAEYERDRKKVR